MVHTISPHVVRVLDHEAIGELNLLASDDSLSTMHLDWSSILCVRVSFFTSHAERNGAGCHLKAHNANSLLRDSDLHVSVAWNVDICCLFLSRLMANCFAEVCLVHSDCDVQVIEDVDRVQVILILGIVSNRHVLIVVVLSVILCRARQVVQV